MVKFSRRNFIKSGLIFVPSTFMEGQITTLPCRRKAFQVSGPSISPNDPVAQWESSSITGLNNGDLVATWPDLSGNGYTMTQSVDASKPTYRTGIFGSQAAVAFGETTNNFMVNVLLPSLPSFTVFMVEKLAFNDDRYVLTGNATWWRTGIAGFALNGDGSLPIHKGGAHLTIINTLGSEIAEKRMVLSWDYGTKHIVTWTYDGTTVTARADGASQTISDYDSGFGLSVPNNIGWSYMYSKASIAAIIVYNRVLTADEIASAESYLNTKYPVF